MGLDADLIEKVKLEFHLTKDEARNFAEVFDLFDADGNGEIDIDELGKMISKHTQKNPPPKKKLKAMMDTVDTDGDGTIGFAEFVQLMLTQVSDPDKQLRNIFADFDTDNSGTIDKPELRKVFEKLSIGIDASQIDYIMSIADKNGDGQIDFEGMLC